MDYAVIMALEAALLLAIVKICQRITQGECTSIRSMDGKTVIVTGADSGIGLETAKELAKRNARVIMAGCMIERAKNVAEEIKNLTGNHNVVAMYVDLSSLKSVRAFAKEVIASEPKLDVLIHNAAIVPEDKIHMTEDNLELQFATNYFGPYLLTRLLLDLLIRSGPSRIVLVSSLNHFLARSLDLKNLNCEKYPRTAFWIYNSTKLAGLLFMRELCKRLVGTKVTVNAAHPGFSRTTITFNMPWFVKYLFMPLSYVFMKSAKSGAQTSLHLAISEEVEDVTGELFADCRRFWMSSVAKDDKLAAKLWNISEKLTGLADKKEL